MAECPIACDLSRLTPADRLREQDLLAALQAKIRGAVETESGWRFRVPADPETLAALGELLAFERLCCPFLAFELAVTADGATLHVHGGDGVKDFVAATFGARSRRRRAQGGPVFRVTGTLAGAADPE